MLRRGRDKNFRLLVTQVPFLSGHLDNPDYNTVIYYQ